MHWVAVVAVLFALFCTIRSQIATKIYSKAENGVDLININVDGRDLAYASNLQMDQTDSADPQTLYFTADRGSPNIYTAQFLKNAGPFSFWTTAKPLVPAAAPFVTFDVSGTNIIGPAFPSGGSNAPTFTIQTIYLGSTPVVENTMFPGYIFYSVLIDPHKLDTGTSWVYLAGWANEQTKSEPFVVARASVTLNSPTPSFNLDSEDVLSIPLPYDYCYDQFDEILRPQMNVTNGYLTLLIPGRCGTFAKIPLSSDPLHKFGQTTGIKTHYPITNLNQMYVSSAVFDHQHEVIYYTLKKYELAGSILYSFNTDAWVLNAPFVDLSRQEIESETIIVLGTELQGSKVAKFIYIVASGANFIQRFEVEKNYTFTSKSFAYLNPKINKISSAHHYFPHLYLTTYEPDAKIYRIAPYNFCGPTCGDYSYCEAGVCYCLQGYVKDVTDPLLQCKPTELVAAEISGRQNQGAAAALGVLFAFSLLAAIAGWVLWYRAKSAPLYTKVTN